MRKIYTPQAYSLFHNNCNNFTNDFSNFLTGSGIPVWLPPDSFTAPTLHQSLPVPLLLAAANHAQQYCRFVSVHATFITGRASLSIPGLCMVLSSFCLLWDMVRSWHLCQSCAYVLPLRLYILALCILVPSWPGCITGSYHGPSSRGPCYTIGPDASTHAVPFGATARKHSPATSWLRHSTPLPDPLLLHPATPIQHFPKPATCLCS